MRKFYCDTDEKEVKPDAVTKVLDLHAVVLLLQSTDIYTGKTTNHAIFQKEVCGLHKDLIVEEGHVAIKEFEEKIAGLAKKPK